MNSFKNVLITFFLSEFGRAMYFVSITWILYELTDDPLFTGALVGLGFLPGLLLNLFFGVAVDRFNRKWLAVLANLLCSLSMATLLLFFSFDKVGPWLIIIVHMILQVAGSLFRPAIQAFLAESFAKEHLPKVFSQSSSAAILGGLLGATVGGLVISVFSATGTLIIVTSCFVIATVSILLIKNEVVVRDEQIDRKSIGKDIVDGFVYIKNHKFLLGLFVIMFNGQLVFHTSLGFLSIYTVDYLEQSATVYGLMDAAISVGGVVAGLLGTWWWKKGKNRIALYSLFIVFVGLMFVGMAPILPVAFMGVFLIGLGTTWIRVLLQSVQQMATDSNYHGRMASYRMIGNQGSVVISAPILGWVASNLGVNYIYLCLLIPIFLCIIFSIIQSNQENFKHITSKIA